MSATKQEIREWFLEEDKGMIKPSSHMLIIRDMFDNSNYPIFVGNIKDLNIALKKYNNIEAMSRVDEVYNLNMDMEKQLIQEHTWNI